MENMTPHHDAHGAHGHAELHPKVTPNKANISASFWFAILLIALFIASVNFVGIMSAGHGHGEEKGTMHTKQETTSNSTAQDHNKEDVSSQDKHDTTQFVAPTTANDPEHHGGAGK